MTGNVGISGGWASGVADFKQHKNPSIPSIPNPYGKMIPVYCWTDAVDHGTEMTELDGVKPMGRK